MKASNIITIIALILVLALIGGLGYGYYQNATMEVKNPIVTMEVQDYGTIKLELYPEMAPEAVANFVALAKNGFYDGTKFHRVMNDFMIQAGSANGDGTGSPKLKDLGIEVSEEENREYCIKGEFLANKYNKNTLKHEEGVISMARGDYTSYSAALTTESYNSASSQFFIVTKDTSSLDGMYAPFGKVIEGLDIVHNIEKVETRIEEKEGMTDEEKAQAEKSIPVKDIVVSKITVDTFGADYGVPETLEPWDYNQWLYQTYGINPNQMIAQ